MRLFGPKRVYDRLNEMIDSALSGTFEERRYDESELSKLEVKWKRFLEASLLSARRVEQERHSIQELVTDISHQTKTPLANILLYTQLLEEQPLNAESRALAQEIQSQSEKLAFLLQSLVKISRLESGILSAKAVRQDVEPLLAALAAQADAKAREKRITLRTAPVHPETEPHPQAVFDLKWTLEAVGNILDNAIKYSPEGSTITLALRVYEMFVCVSVADEGIGIPEAERARVFERFYRGANVRQEEGVGVGLYLARQIVSAQGGYIKVGENREAAQTGAVFSVYLPRPL
ncbi:MAG: HAMP domain-containing histidine kinase [Roseburia sp.]|nr:HAMP domain-containing histidine kinase [Roseburia sp.]